MDNTAQTVLTRTDWSVNVGPSACIINYYVLQTVLMQFLSLKFPRMKTTRKVIKLKRRNLRRKAKKPSSNTSLAPVSYENSDSLKPAKKNPDMRVFADRLLLLIHSLLAFSDESPDQNFRAKCKQHLEDDWLQKPVVLQSCMSTINLLDDKKVHFLSLSDSGSTLSFVSANFVKKHRLSIMGQWRGSLQSKSRLTSTNWCLIQRMVLKLYCVSRLLV